MTLNAQAETIIEVSITSDGKIDYRLRTSLLNTAQYGQILATIAANIGKMFHAESPLLEPDKVTAEIVAGFMAEVDIPAALTSFNQLQ